MVRSQLHTEMTAKQKALRDTPLDENQISRNETLNRNKETENSRVEIPHDTQDKTEDDSEVGTGFRSFAFEKNSLTTWKKPQNETKGHFG